MRLFNLRYAACLLGFFLLIPSAFAEQVQVLTMESDAIQGITTVSVNRDNSGEMKALTAKTPTQTITFTLAQLRTPQVFKEIDGRKVVFFSLEKDFNPYQGGHANMRFLHNAITGNYRNFRMDVEVNGKDIVLRSDPNSADPESDHNDYTSTFNYVFMAANTFFGKAIGIDTVSPELRQGMEIFFPKDGPAVQWF